MKKTFVEYVWIDNVNKYRSKTRVLDRMVSDVGHVPLWNFDGSSTGQIYNNTINNTEVFLKPVCLFNDPFRKKNHKIVLCECYDELDVPNSSNTRHCALENAFRYKKNLKPWFGLEQEYFICEPSTGLPVGYHPMNISDKHYCGIGTNNIFLRHIPNLHLTHCAYAGVKISGINAEVCPSQWEFQIGPCEGISAGDHLHMGRYILHRICESYGYFVNYHPKLLEGKKWSGSGCHINFSTVKMREGTKKYSGYHFIQKAIIRLQDSHDDIMDFYGEYNNLRLNGLNNTSDYNKFSWSIGGRCASLRVGNNVYENKQGFFEDRRPASNIDPYLATSKLFQVTCL